MLWRKPAGMHYTDLCIFIDQNVPKIATETAEPGVADTVYNYLWLLTKALAIKKRMFQKFEDYDGYAFYAANRLYFALIKNYHNQGKRIKGKEIRPIKSCLNYTKALLNPMKLEYQKETFNEVIAEDFVSKKFDAFTYKEHLKQLAYSAQMESEQLAPFMQDSMRMAPALIDKVLKKSPFKPGSVDYKKLKISILLNCAAMLRSKKQLTANPTTIFLWKLPKTMAGYVRVLLKEFYAELKLEIIDSYRACQVSDEILERLITNPTGEEPEYEEQD